MRLTNFQMDNIALALDAEPSPLATVEVRLSFHDDTTHTANVVTTRVRIPATDDFDLSPGIRAIAGWNLPSLDRRRREDR